MIYIYCHISCFFIGKLLWSMWKPLQLGVYEKYFKRYLFHKSHVEVFLFWSNAKEHFICGLFLNLSECFASETHRYLSDWKQLVMPLTADLTSAQIKRWKIACRSCCSLAAQLCFKYRKKIQNNPIQFSHKDQVQGLRKNTKAHFEPPVMGTADGKAVITFEA